MTPCIGSVMVDGRSVDRSDEFLAWMTTVWFSVSEDNDSCLDGVLVCEMAVQVKSCLSSGGVSKGVAPKVASAAVTPADGHDCE